MKNKFIKEQEEKLDKECEELGQINKKFNWKPLTWAAAIFGIAISGGLEK